MRLKHKSMWKLCLTGVSSTVVTCKFSREDSFLLHLSSLGSWHLLPLGSITPISACIFTGPSSWCLVVLYFYKSTIIEDWASVKCHQRGNGSVVKSSFKGLVQFLAPVTSSMGSITLFWPPSTLAYMCIHSHGPDTWVKIKLLNTSLKVIKLVIRKHRRKKCFSSPLCESSHAVEKCFHMENNNVA